MRLLYWLRRGDVSQTPKPSMAISDPASKLLRSYLFYLFAYVTNVNCIHFID